MPDVRLVLIETSGNQAYIFSSNRLRENVGASHLTFWVGSALGVEVAQRMRGVAKIEPDRTKFLLDPQANPPIERQLEQGKDPALEVVLATSGKILALAGTAEIGKEFIRQVSLNVLQRAPGLDVHGVLSTPFDLHSDNLDERLQEVHQRFAESHAKRGPATRHLRLPIVTECSSTGFPAEGIPDSRGEVLSSAARAKRQAADEGWERLKRLLQECSGTDVRFAPDIDTIEHLMAQSNGERWMAVAHADGNGLGQIFLSFAEYAGASDNRTYVNRLRVFSMALEQCTERAFMQAVATTWQPAGEGNSWTVPVVPLVLGGDDVTFLASGTGVLGFLEKVLTNFQELTERSEILRTVSGRRFLSMAAGVVFVKPHFPFFVAYDLAEALTTSAKQVKMWWRSSDHPLPGSLDFAVVHDSSAISAGGLRNMAEDVRLFGGPYILLDEAVRGGRQGADTGLGPNLERRDWERLKRKVEAFRMVNCDGDRALPAAQSHVLRQAVANGPDEANRALGLIRQRYPVLNQLVEENDSLFWRAPTDDRGPNGPYVTAYLDVMEAADVWEVTRP